MLDWLTASLPFSALPEQVWQHLSTIGDRIMRYCPRSNEVKWESPAWDSVRSDSHQIAFRVGSDAIHIQGSPCRVVGDGDAVFGPVDGLRPADGLRAMVRHACKVLSVILPLDPSLWRVSRMDCTVHLLFDDLPSVRVALAHLRNLEGGRYRVSQQAGDTVYWNHSSRRKAAKAYAKGPHLSYLMRRKDYTGRQYSESEIALANRLLRLELRLGSQFWNEQNKVSPWFEMSAADVDAAAWVHFDKLLGDASVIHVSDLEASLRSVTVNGESLTDGAVRSALGLWGLIGSFGWERAREMTPRTTWYRNLKFLRLAGLSDLDISSGRIVELRAERLCCARRVTSWSELRAVA